MKLLKDMNSDKKSFCKWTGSKSKSKKNVDPLLNEVGDLVIKDMERLRYYVFTGNVCPQAS